MTTLVASKHYNMLYEGQKQHSWKHDRSKVMGITDWVGKTVGIAGYGSIGRQGRCCSRARVETGGRIDDNRS